MSTTTADRGSPAPPEAHRGGGARRGDEAKRWFASHETTLDSPDVGVFADDLVAGDFRLARIWHTAAGLVSTRTRPGLLLVIQLDGACRIRIAAEGPQDFDPGSLAVIPSGAGHSFESSTPVARMEIEVGEVALPEALLRAVAAGIVLDDSLLSATLTSCVNSALNSSLQPQTPGFAAFRLAIGNLVTATLLSSIATVDDQEDRRVPTLFREAKNLIARRAADTAFSVSALADELRISSQYLRSIFATHGTTARAEIMRARLALAEQFLHGSDGGRLSPRDAARLAGFRDERAMQAALRRRRPAVADGAVEEDRPA